MVGYVFSAIVVIGTMSRIGQRSISHHYCLPTFHIISTTVAHMLLFFAPTNALLNGHPGGLTLGTPGHLHNDIYKYPLPKINGFF